MVLSHLSSCLFFFIWSVSLFTSVFFFCARSFHVHCGYLNCFQICFRCFLRRCFYFFSFRCVYFLTNSSADCSGVNHAKVHMSLVSKRYNERIAVSPASVSSTMEETKPKTSLWFQTMKTDEIFILVFSFINHFLFPLPRPLPFLFRFHFSSSLLSVLFCPFFLLRFSFLPFLSSFPPCFPVLLVLFSAVLRLFLLLRFPCDESSACSARQAAPRPQRAAFSCTIEYTVFYLNSLPKSAQIRNFSLSIASVISSKIVSYVPPTNLLRLS